MNAGPDPYDVQRLREANVRSSISTPTSTPTPAGLAPKRAHDRVSAENLSRMAIKLGRCGDINPITGYVCVTQPHPPDAEHMAVQIGGPSDGKVYSRWGGTAENQNQISTQKLAKPDS